MRVKVTKVSCSGGYLEVGEIYDVFKNETGITYILDSVNHKLYFDLLTGRCSWFEPTLDDRAFTFEEVLDKPKYATSPEALAQVLRKMADNILAGLEPCEGIQFKVDDGVWWEAREVNHLEEFEYRVKPETITLKNGIEVPKPLNDGDITDPQQRYFTPCCNDKMCYSITGYIALRFNYKLIYETKEEAIEASKALFGLEIKDV